MSANQALLDRAVRHSAALTRYGNGLAARAVELLNEVDDEITEKLAGALASVEQGGRLTPAQRARLLRVLEEVRAINRAIYERLATLVGDELQELAVAEAAYQRDALRASIALDTTFAVPVASRLATIVQETPIHGRILAPWINAMGEARAAELERTLRLGLARSETTAQLVQRIRGTKAGGFNDGVLGVSRRSAQTLARTSVTHVSNMAAQETWRANSNVVKAWQFVATLDIRTTSECGSKDGQTYPIGEGPIPPLHPNCRSITVAVTKSWEELGQTGRDAAPRVRASMDGQVAGSSRYDKWLAGRSAAVQDEVLGPTRGKLFRENKLTLQQMVAPDGGKLTLDELRAKYPSILN